MASYLVGENVNGDWKALDKKFLSSRYYMETKAFLESDVLYKMLEKQECMLDVKVHPIFKNMPTILLAVMTGYI